MAIYQEPVGVSLERQQQENDMAEDKKGPREQVGGKIFVTRVFGKNGEEENEDKDMEVRRFESEPAYVRANYGLTINLGNYESARCDVSVTLPCYMEEIDAAFVEAWKIAKREIQDQVKSIRKKA